jgi:hypothetical protein
MMMITLLAANFKMDNLLLAVKRDLGLVSSLPVPDL